MGGYYGDEGHNSNMMILAVALTLLVLALLGLVFFAGYMAGAA